MLIDGVMLLWFLLTALSVAYVAVLAVCAAIALALGTGTSVPPG